MFSPLTELCNLKFAKPSETLKFSDTGLIECLWTLVDLWFSDY